MTSCYTREEGCLDAAAVNFSPRADDDCCCEYPRLVLKFSHKVDTLNFSFNTTYQLDADQLITFSDMRFYLSNVHLIKDDGTELGVENIINVETSTGEVLELEDNFSIIDKDVFVDTIGQFRNDGTYTELKFYVGIPSPANTAIPDSITTRRHPLGLFPDTLWNATNGYVFNRIQLFKDTMENTELTTYELDGIASLVEVILPINFEVLKGKHAELTIKIDYGAWFTGIDFAATDMEVIDNIIENTTNAFSIIE